MVLLCCPCEWNVKTVETSVYSKKFFKKRNVGRTVIILVGMRKSEKDRSSVPAHCQAYMTRQNHSSKVVLKKKVGHIYWWILFKLSIKFRRKIKNNYKINAQNFFKLLDFPLFSKKVQKLFKYIIHHFSVFQKLWC